MKLNFIELCILGVVIGCLIFVAFTYFEIKKEGPKCLGNPIQYGIRKLEEQNNDNILCSCYGNKIKGSLVFTNETTEIKQSTSTSNNYNLRLQ